MVSKECQSPKMYDSAVLSENAELENKITNLQKENNKQKEVLDKIKKISKENIDDEFYINLTNKEKALYKIHDLLEEIE